MERRRVGRGRWKRRAEERIIEEDMTIVTIRPAFINERAGMSKFHVPS